MGSYCDVMVRSCKFKFNHFVFICLALACSTVVAAGEIRLRNGDRLLGELKAVESTRVIWEADSTGKVSIDRAEVIYIRTTKPVSIELNAALVRKELSAHPYDDCVFGESASGNHLLRCANGVELVIDNLNQLGLAYAKPLHREKTIKDSGSVSVRVEVKDDNDVDSREYEFDANVELRRMAERHKVKYSYDYEKQENLTIENDLDLYYQYDYFISDVYYRYGNVRYRRDEVDDLRRKYAAGIGLGYQVFEHDLGSLNIEGGPQYEEERFRTDDDRSQFALRWALDFAWKVSLLTEAEIFHKHEITQSLESAGDYEFDSATGLRVPLNEHLKALLQYEYDYDHLPSQGSGKIERITTVGINYDW